MSDWLAAIDRLQPRVPSFAEDIATLHNQFERIHPFLDGSGRAGRLILNLVLVRMGYPPAIIYTNERAEYLRALRRADQGDCGALGEFIARAILDNLYKFIVPTPDRPACYRSPRWSRLRPTPTRCEPPPCGDASTQRRDRTDSGGVPATGSTSTSSNATGARRRRGHEVGAARPLRRVGRAPGGRHPGAHRRRRRCLRQAG